MPSSLGAGSWAPEQHVDENWLDHYVTNEETASTAFEIDSSAVGAGAAEASSIGLGPIVGGLVLGGVIGSALDYGFNIKPIQPPARPRPALPAPGTQGPYYFDQVIQSTIHAGPGYSITGDSVDVTYDSGIPDRRGASQNSRATDTLFAALIAALGTLVTGCAVLLKHSQVSCVCQTHGDEPVPPQCSASA